MLVEVVGVDFQPQPVMLAVAVAEVEAVECTELYIPLFSSQIFYMFKWVKAVQEVLLAIQEMLATLQSYPSALRPTAINL
jgi:hypothetical protein